MSEKVYIGLFTDRDPNVSESAGVNAPRDTVGTLHPGQPGVLSKDEMARIAQLEADARITSAEAQAMAEEGGPGVFSPGTGSEEPSEALVTAQNDLAEAERHLEALKSSPLTKKAELKSAEEAVKRHRLAVQELRGVHLDGTKTKAATKAEKAKQEEHAREKERQADAASVERIPNMTPVPPTPAQAILMGGVEVEGIGYKRVESDHGSDWETVGAGTKRNKKKFSFPKAESDWGNIVSFIVFNAPTGGNPIFSGTLREPIRVRGGDQVVFQPGQLVRA